MGKPTPIGGGGSLPDIRMIMTIMRILMVKSLCQAVMGRVPILECMLPDKRGFLWLRHVMLGIKWCCFSRTWLQCLYLVLERPPDMTTRGSDAC
jgi:hypothetical protein